MGRVSIREAHWSPEDIKGRMDIYTLLLDMSESKSSAFAFAQSTVLAVALLGLTLVVGLEQIIV